MQTQPCLRRLEASRARAENIVIDDRATMAQLGHSAGIAVGAAVIAVLRRLRFFRDIITDIL